MNPHTLGYDNDDYRKHTHKKYTQNYWIKFSNYGGKEMIKEALEKLINEFPTYYVKEVFPFQNSPLADFIRQELPAIFSREFNQFPTLVWRASPGLAQWADAPWIAAFNPLVAETAQDGYYPVFLFTTSLDKIYLSLNQGMTKVREELGDKAGRSALAHRAEILRRRLHPDYQDAGFLSDPIDLQARGPNTRQAYYEPGHAFGKTYYSNHIPTDNELRADISNMLRLYALAFSRGGISELDLEDLAPDPSMDGLDFTVEEKKKYKYHKTVERNPKLSREAKRIHGYTCQVCNFNFQEGYGAIGENFIEAHHKTPIANVPDDQFVKWSAQNDFAVVCSNCHSMLHRKNALHDFNAFVIEYRNRL